MRSSLFLTALSLSLFACSDPLKQDLDADGVTAADDCDDNDATLGAIADDSDCDGILLADDCDDADENSTIVAEDGDVYFTDPVGSARDDSPARRASRTRTSQHRRSTAFCRSSRPIWGTPTSTRSRACIPTSPI